MIQMDTQREFERSIPNLLPWNATSRKKARNAQYDQTTSEPFKVDEIIAVRDEPGSWFYLARVTTVGTTCIIVHYYGTRSANISLATFSPGWHLPNHDFIRLAKAQPQDCIRYSGVLQYDALNTLLVARKLIFNSASRLTSKSRKLLMPIRDELFIFE